MVSVARGIAVARGLASGLSAPTNIAGLLGWESDFGTFQERTGASATTPASADTDPIGTWTNRYGTSYYAITDNDAKRPTNQTNEINSLPAVRFDGVNDILKTAAFAAELTQPNTIILVSKYLTDPATAAIVVDGLTSGKRHAFVVEERGGVNDKGMYSGGIDGVYFISTLPETNFHTEALIFNGASSLYYVDGVSKTLTGLGGTNPGSNSLDGLALGARGFDETLPANVDIVAAYIAPSALTSGQLNQMGSYTQAKYGITWTPI